MDEFAKGQRDRVYANPDVKAGSFDLKLVEDMFLTLSHDRTEYDLCHDYFEGKQLLPYAPRNATAQIRDLQQRSIANWIPLLVNLPSQMSFVDDYRRRQGGMLEKKSKAKTAENTSTEWRLWQRNRMDGRQAIVYRSVLLYGHAFVCVNNIDPKNITYDILSTRNTVAYFRDPVNDIRPSHVLTIKSYPRSEKVPGLAILWDDEFRWEMTYTMDGKFIVKGKPFKHNLEKCPVVRYTCFLDDEGRTRGVVKPAIPLQDRLNQATFSTNVTSDFGAFKVRWAAGLMPSFRKDENGDIILDANDEPIPEPIEVSQAALLLSDDPATKFGQLDETPLDGYIRQEEQAARNFTTLSQFPPLASIANLANLSAEAWSAAEAQFIRWIDSLHISLGESHEELMRLGALASGDKEGADSYGGEVRWRDMSTRTVAVMMDALGKAAQMLDVPRKGLWPLIPGVTNGMLDDWDELHEEQIVEDEARDPRMQQAKAAGAQKIPTANAAQKKPLSGNGG
ncbi:MAG TPA: phage portal protein [Arthrobacter sp.]|nr:phage portal protein [Arthrobacter sp.]